MIKNLFKNKLIWGVLLMLIFSNSAFAETSLTSFTNNPDDILIKGMGQFFGTDGTTIDAQSGFSLTMQEMVLSVLSPAFGMVLIYSLIHFITKSASTGKVAVKDMGYLWFPKVLIGYVLLYPATSGWPLICMVVYYFFTFSISLGSSMGTIFIDNAPKNIIYSNEYAYSRLFPLLSKMVNANVCVLEANNYISKIEKQGSMSTFLASVNKNGIKPNFSMTSGTSTDSGGTHFMISYGDKSGAFVLGRNMCSLIDYVLTNRTSDVDLSDNVLDSTNAPKLADIKTRFNQIHMQQLIALDQKAKELAQYQLSDGFNLDTYKTMFASATTDYATALQDAGNTLAQEYINSDNYSEIMKLGPAMYGTLPASMGIIQGSIQQAKDSLPEVTGLGINNSGLKEVGLGPVVIGSVSASNNINNEVIGMISPSKAITKGDPSLTDADESVFMKLAVGPFADLMDFKNVVKQANYLANPMFTGQQLGYDIIHGISGVGARFITLGLVTIPIPGISLFIAWFGNSVMTPIILGLMIPAVTLAYIIPLLPVITWVGVLAGWCLGLVRSMFVMVVGLMTFIYADPQGFVGKTGQLYLVMLEDILRIPLSVAGFFIGWQLMPIIHYFITLCFSAVFNTNLTGFDGLTAGVVNLIVYTLVTYGNIKACLSLSSTLPDITISLLGRTSQLMGSTVREIAGAGDTAARGVADASRTITNGMLAGAGKFGRAENNAKNRLNPKGNDSSSRLDFQAEGKEGLGRFFKK